MKKLAHEEIARLSMEELAHMRRFPISILLENIRSAFNVGSILRTADAIRAEQVILAGVTPDGNHRGVNKSALGAQESVPWIHVDSAFDTVVRLRNDGYQIVALELTDEPTSLSDLKPDVFPVCLLVGNEVSGLTEELIALSDLAVEIPQYGMKQSLNVAVAAGVAMYGLSGVLQKHDYSGA